MYIENFLVFSDVEKVLYSQTFGGLVFAFFGGTPHIVLLTTAPLALYTKSMYIYMFCLTNPPFPHHKKNLIKIVIIKVKVFRREWLTDLFN